MSKKLNRSVIAAAIIGGLSVADACDKSENHDGYQPIRKRASAAPAKAQAPAMATAKAPNYTEEQTAKMLKAYDPKADEATREAAVAALAVEFGKGVRSIVAKLSRAGVYVPKAYKTKAGEKPVKKDETADAIGKVLKLSEPETESLAKANKTALKKVWDALANSVPRPVESPEQEAQKATHVLYIAEYAGLEPEELPALKAVPAETIGMMAEAMGYQEPGTQSE